MPPIAITTNRYRQAFFEQAGYLVFLFDQTDDILQHDRGLIRGRQCWLFDIGESDCIVHAVADMMRLFYHLEHLENAQFICTKKMESVLVTLFSAHCSRMYFYSTHIRKISPDVSNQLCDVNRQRAWINRRELYIIPAANVWQVAR